MQRARNMQDGRDRSDGEALMVTHVRASSVLVKLLELTSCRAGSGDTPARSVMISCTSAAALASAPSSS